MIAPIILDADAVPHRRQRVVCVVVVVLAILIIGLGVGLGVGLGLSSSSSSPSAQPDVYVMGVVQDSFGNPVSGATVSGSQGNAVTTSKGEFSVYVTPSSATRFAFNVTKTGYLPQIGAGMVSTAASYYVPVTLTAAASPILFTNGQTFTWSGDLNQANYTIVIKAGSLYRGNSKISSSETVYLYVTEVMPQNSPGLLDTVDMNEYGSNNLQSAGMFYMEVTDSSGTQLTMNPAASVTIQPAYQGTASQVQGAASLAYSLNAQGQWYNVSAPSNRRRDSIYEAGYAAAAAAGYWNSDRAYKTACVVGKIQAPGGVTCAGTKATAGSFGIVSHSNTDASGNYCLEGPVGLQSYMSVGYYSNLINFPSTAGTCANPSSCTNVGTSVLSAATVCPQPPATTASPSSGGGCSCTISCNFNIYGLTDDSIDTLVCSEINQQFASYQGLYGCLNLAASCSGGIFSYTWSAPAGCAYASDLTTACSYIQEAYANVYECSASGSGQC